MRRKYPIVGCSLHLFQSEDSQASYQAAPPKDQRIHYMRKSVGGRELLSSKNNYLNTDEARVTQTPSPSK